MQQSGFISPQHPSRRDADRGPRAQDEEEEHDAPPQPRVRVAMEENRRSPVWQRQQYWHSTRGIGGGGAVRFDGE
jgi:hypothetical protein